MDAGRINATWLTVARHSEHDNETVEDWFLLAINSKVEIDEKGSVWDERRGCWLSQDRIDAVCAKIDRGL